ncbi:MAG: VapC toxin family PIN domain ribonuclease [Thermoanaerobaculia bacterium]
MHARALPWLRRARRRDFEFLLAGHNLAETFAVLTTLPVRPHISPAVARELIQRNTGGIAHVVTLSVADCERVLDRIAALGVSGGAVYDALIGRAAEKSGADRLLTLNPSDFERVWPEGKMALTVP